MNGIDDICSQSLGYIVEFAHSQAVIELEFLALMEWFGMQMNREAFWRWQEWALPYSNALGLHHSRWSQWVLIGKTHKYHPGVYWCWCQYNQKGDLHFQFLISMFWELWSLQWACGQKDREKVHHWYRQWRWHHHNRIGIHQLAIVWSLWIQACQPGTGSIHNQPVFAHKGCLVAWAHGNHYCHAWFWFPSEVSCTFPFLWVLACMPS